MADLFEHEMQTREAFSHVKEDIYSLNHELTQARLRLDSIQKTFELYPDKKEFYLFVETMRTELDRLEDALATKQQVETLTQKLEKLDAQSQSRFAQLDSQHRKDTQALADQRKKDNEELEAIQSRIKARINQIDEKLSDLSASSASKDRVRELENSAAKSFSSVDKQLKEARQQKANRTELAHFTSKNSERFARFEQSAHAGQHDLIVRMQKVEHDSEALREDMRILKANLRQKERQIERISQRTHSSSKTVGAPRKLSRVPRQAWILIGIILLVVLLVFSVPRLIPIPVQNQSYSAQNQAQINKCIADFECREVSPGSFYADCTYDELVGDCRCAIVPDISLCNAAAKQKVKEAALRENGSIMPFVIVFIGMGIIFLALWLASRKRKG